MMLMTIACLIAAFICGITDLVIASTQAAAVAQTLFGLFLLTGLVLFTVCVFAQNHQTAKTGED